MQSCRDHLGNGVQTQRVVHKPKFGGTMAAAATDQRRRTSGANDGDESSNLESVLQDEGADWSAIRRALKNRGGLTNAAVIVSLHQNEGRPCVGDGSNGSRCLGEKGEGQAHQFSTDDRTSTRITRRSPSFVATLEHVREEKPCLECSNGGLDSPPRSPSSDEVHNRPIEVTVVTQDLIDQPRPERRKRSAARRLMGRGSSTFRASLKNRFSRTHGSSSGSIASSSAGGGTGSISDSVNIMDFGVPSRLSFTESMVSLASSASGGASARRRSSEWSNHSLADSCADLVDSTGFLSWAARDNGSDVESSDRTDGSRRRGRPAILSNSNFSQEVDEQGFLGQNNDELCVTQCSKRPTDDTGSNSSVDEDEDVDEDGFLGWGEKTARSLTKSEVWNIEDYEGDGDEYEPPIDTPSGEGRLSQLIKGMSTNVVERLTAVSLQNEVEHFPKSQDSPAKDDDKTVKVRTALLRRISIEKGGQEAEEEEKRPSGLFSALRRRKTISTARPVFSRRASVEANNSRTAVSRRATVESEYSRKPSGGSSRDVASHSRKGSRQSASSNERGGYDLRGSTVINIRNDDGVDINAMRKELLEALPSDKEAVTGFRWIH